MTRILIVEDDPTIREPLAGLLREVGYAVLEARNGAEGLRQAAEQRPDLILLDLTMPAMNGSEFLTAQREDSALVDIPVIAMSAGTLGEDVAMGRVAARISKPFDIMALLEEVRRVAVAAAGAPARP